MRKKGTRYQKIEQLPPNAVPVSEWANDKEIQVGTVYMAFKRFDEGYTTGAGNKSKGSDPGYSIRCYKGMNFVVPHK